MKYLPSAIGHLALGAGLVCAILSLVACEPLPSERDPGPMQPSAAERALKAAGFTDIKLGGMPVFQCGEDDSLLASHEFTAIGPTGQRVSGAVCCGLIFKGCTVRF